MKGEIKYIHDVIVDKLESRDKYSLDDFPKWYDYIFRKKKVENFFFNQGEATQLNQLRMIISIRNSTDEDREEANNE